MDELCADFEQIMPIDEFSVLQEALTVRKHTPEIINNTEWRYRRYIMRINDWSDRKGTDYTYIKTKINEFISEKDYKKRCSLMKYIDTELMMMVSMCRIDDMEF